MRILSLFIDSSLDGSIAKPNDDFSFLKLLEKEGENMWNSRQILTPQSLEGKHTIGS